MGQACSVVMGVKDKSVIVAALLKKLTLLLSCRSFFIALFRHILNVGQKGCYRTALELCKLLLNLSPDDDPLAVSLMIDFYALRAQEYSWLVALYDVYEPTKNLSMVSV